MLLSSYKKKKTTLAFYRCYGWPVCLILAFIYSCSHIFFYVRQLVSVWPFFFSPLFRPRRAWRRGEVLLAPDFCRQSLIFDRLHLRMRSIISLLYSLDFITIYIVIICKMSFHLHFIDDSKKEYFL